MIPCHVWNIKLLIKSEASYLISSSHISHWLYLQDEVENVESKRYLLPKSNVSSDLDRLFFGIIFTF